MTLLTLFQAPTATTAGIVDGAFIVPVTSIVGVDQGTLSEESKVVPVPAIPNIITNIPVAGFEVPDATPYVAGGISSTIFIIGGGSVEGRQGLYITANAAGYPYYYFANYLDGAPVVPGNTYTAAVWAQGTGGFASSAAHITWYDINGSYLSGNDGTATSISSAFKAQLSVTAVAPANAAWAVPQYQSANPVASGDTAVIDAFSIANGSTAAPLTTPVILSYVDSATLTESSFTQPVAITTDSAALTDSSGQSIVSSSVDIGTLSDSSSVLQANNVSTADTVALSDISQPVIQTANSDSATFTDTSAVAPITTNGIVDGAFIAGQPTIIGSDTGTVTEVSAQSATLSRPDSAVVADSSALTFSSARVDSGALADASAVFRATSTTDAATETEFSSVAAVSSRTDSAALTDISSVVTYAPTNGIVDGAYLNAQLSIVGVDSPTLGEVSATSSTMSCTDSATMTDTSSVVVILSRSDSITAADSRFIGEFSSRVDAAALTESRTTNVVLSSTDSITFSEQPTPNPTQLISTVDSANFTDIAAYAVVVTRSDAFTEGETSSVIAKMTGTDGGTLSESTSIMSKFVKNDIFRVNDVSDRYIITPFPHRTDLFNYSGIAGIKANTVRSDAAVLSERSQVEVINEFEQVNDRFTLTDQSGLTVFATVNIPMAFYGSDRDLVSSSLTAKGEDFAAINSMIVFQSQQRDVVVSSVSFQSNDLDGIQSSLDFLGRDYDAVVQSLTFESMSYSAITEATTFYSADNGNTPRQVVVARSPVVREDVSPTSFVRNTTTTRSFQSGTSTARSRIYAFSLDERVLQNAQSQNNGTLLTSEDQMTSETLLTGSGTYVAPTTPGAGNSYNAATTSSTLQTSTTLQTTQGNV